MLNAEMRGVGFELTYAEWYGIWLASGKLSERGRKADQYCMARIGDTGVYCVGNVKIITNRENALENWKRRVQGKRERLKRSKTIKRYWDGLTPRQRAARVRLSSTARYGRT